MLPLQDSPTPFRQLPITTKSPPPRCTTSAPLFTTYREYHTIWCSDTIVLRYIDRDPDPTSTNARRFVVISNHRTLLQSQEGQPHLLIYQQASPASSTSCSISRIVHSQYYCCPLPSTRALLVRQSSSATTDIPSQVRQFWLYDYQRPRPICSSSPYPGPSIHG